MHHLIEQALMAKSNLLEHEAMQLLSEYGLPTPKHALTTDPDQAADTAREIGFPVVLKVVSPAILHKSDVGGVKVGLKTEAEVKDAYREILLNIERRTNNAPIVGILVASQASPGLECIVGMTSDPQFGPALMFGLGGIFVEVLKDVSFRLLPISKEEAEDMVKETKGYKLIQGIRGEEPKDFTALVDIILKLSLLIEENPEIKELDLNPLFLYESGLQIVDARVLI